MKLKLSVVYVADQDDALGFYRDMLGLKVKRDASYGPNARWVTVVSPEDEDGVELLLSKVDPQIGSDEFQRRQYEAGKPALSFDVADVQAVFDDLSAKGVRFSLAPTSQPYGGIDAVADDGCGNYVNFSEET